MQFRRLSFLFAAAAALAPSVDAANQTWIDTNTDNTWSTAAGNWDAGVGWTPNNSAIFGGTGETVTLTAVTADDLTFNSTGYVISGGTLTLAGTPSISVVNSGQSATISSVVAGTAGLTVTGSGTTILAGNNTYTGTTTISSGTLQLGGTNASTAYAIGAGAVLELNVASGTRDGGASQNFTGTGTLRKTGAGAIVWGGTVANFALGSGALIDVQAGTFTAGSNANDVWTANKADLNVAAGATFDAVEATATASGGIFVDALSGAGTIKVGYQAGYSNTITFGVDNGSGVFTGSLQNSIGAGNYVKAGTGTQTLAGANTYTGTTTVTGGTLALDYSTQDNSKLADAAALILAGGTVSLAGGTHTEIVGSTTLQSGANTLTRTSGSAKLALGAITSTGGTLNLTTSGIATTTNANVNGILAPWLTVGSADFAANDGTGLIVAYSSYTDVPYAGTIANGAATNVRLTGGTSGDVVLSGGVTTVNAINQNQTGAVTIDIGTGNTLRLGASGAILVGAGKGALTIGKTGAAGTLTAGGANNTAGTLSVVTFGDSVTINAAITDNGTGSVGLSQLGTGTLTLTGANTYTGGTVIGGVMRLAFAGNATLSGVISGSGSLIKDTGTGTLTLSGANTYAGTTTLSSGTVVLGNAAALGSTAGGTTVASGATLDLNGQSVGAESLTLGGLLLNSSGTAASLSGAITLTAPATFGGTGNMTLSGVISGAFAVVKNGNSTLTLSGNNAYTGALSVNGGTLVLNSPSYNTFSGSAININNASTLLVTTSGGANRYDINGKTITFDANGGGSLTTGSGLNWVFSGNTIVTSGGAKNRISGASAINLNFSSISFNVASGTDTTTDLQVDISFANGSGTLTKSGAGRLQLNASAAYGATVINGGTLQVAGSAQLSTEGQPAGTITSTVSNAGVFRYSSSANQIINGVVSGTGSIVKDTSAASTLTLGGANTYGGGTTVSLGVLAAAHASALGSGAVTVSGGELQTTVAAVGGMGGLTMSSGTLTLNGTAAGTVTLAAGANLVMTGGTWKIGLATGTDVIAGSGAGTFSLTAGTLDLGGGAINYGATYNLITGFASGSVSNVSFTNYDSSQWSASLSNAGVLSFTAVPEPSTYGLLGAGCLAGLAFVRRRSRRA